MKEEENKEMIKLIQDICENLETKNNNKKYPKIIMCSDEQTEEEKQLLDKELSEKITETGHNELKKLIQKCNNNLDIKNSDIEIPNIILWSKEKTEEEQKEFIPVDLSFQHLYPFEQINWADLRPDSNQFHEGEDIKITEERLQKCNDSIIKMRKIIKQNPQKQVLIHENLIDNFSEGAEERLKRSAIFNTIFNSLLTGQSPFQVIEDLCNIHDNMCAEHSKLIMENYRPPSIKVDIKDLNGPMKLELMSSYGKLKKPEYKRKNLNNLQNPDNND